MNSNLNTLQIKALESYSSRAGAPVMTAIKNASTRSGVDFSYLVQQAAAESNFNVNAKAKTSSATGLYQFIDKTWVSMIERYGDQYGLDTNGKDKSDILAMRKDPRAASFMAAAFASENEKSLNRNWGGDVGATELYFAHFMGASGASSFLNARDENPLQRAADLFPRAAKSNHNVFYDMQSGKPKTLEEVYQFFDKKFQIKGDGYNNNMIAKAPIPPEMPDSKKLANEKLALELQTAHYGSISRGLSNSLVMQRSQEMRDQAALGRSLYNAYDKISHFQQMNDIKPPDKSLEKFQEERSPFLTRLSNPVEVMFFTQTTPSKVVRDNV